MERFGGCKGRLRTYVAFHTLRFSSKTHAGWFAVVEKQRPRTAGLWRASRKAATMATSLTSISEAQAPYAYHQYEGQSTSSSILEQSRVEINIARRRRKHSPKTFIQFTILLKSRVLDSFVQKINPKLTTDERERNRYT